MRDLDDVLFLDDRYGQLWDDYTGPSPASDPCGDPFGPGTHRKARPMPTTTAFTLTAAERTSLIAKLRELEAQDASIIYRDATDNRTNAQIQREVDELYECIDAVVSVLTADANRVLPDSLPDHIRECAAEAIDPLAFLAALDESDYQTWCERDHP